MTIEETAVTINVEGRKLHGMLYLPSQSESVGAALFCHPLFEERKSAHRVMVETARACSAAGLLVLRFDYTGTGDSSGNFTDCSLAMWLQDMRTAVEFLRHCADGLPLGLLGVRAGATMAVCFATGLFHLPASTSMLPTERSTHGISFLTLWEPILKGSDYLQELFRKKLIKEMMTTGSGRTTKTRILRELSQGRAVDLDGYALSATLYHDLTRLELGTRITELNVPTLFLHFAPGGRQSPDIDRLRTAISQANLPAEVYTIPEQPFWNSIGVVQSPEAIRVTVEWLQERCRKPSNEAIPMRNELRSSVSTVPTDSTNSSAGEEPVCFQSAGKTLRGVLHVPTRFSNVRGSVILLHGWAGSRLGPHDMFVHMARRLASIGFICLRFDFGGRGDSDGKTTAATIRSMTEDAIAAVAFLEAQRPSLPLFLVGICSGCKVAIGTAVACQGIRGLALWSAEPMGDLRKPTSKARKSAFALRTYLTKLFQKETWHKLLTRRINLKLVRRAILGNEAPNQEELIEEEEILRQFRTFRGELLFIYGSRDPETANAAKAYHDFCQHAGIRNTIHEITGANHNFYSIEWEEQVMKHTAEWMLSQTKESNDGH
ncbi:MAG: alpha/beta fold hydrolase [Kiritimatiellia bacterium]